MKNTLLFLITLLVASPLFGQQPNYPYSTVQVPGATGGPPSAGGVNATGYEINGVPISSAACSGGPCLPLAGGTMTGATGGAPIAGGINATQYLLNGVPVVAINENPSVSGGPNILLDSDLGQYVDDVTAIALLSNAHIQQQVNFLGIGISTKTTNNAVAAKAELSYYGLPQTPVCLTNNASAPTRADIYASIFASTYAHGLQSNTTAPACTAFYRQIFASIPDQSLTWIISGPWTNVFNLYNSAADSISPLTGAQLITAKVKQFVVSGGDYPTGSENNLTAYPAASQTINQLETEPITWIGSTIGPTVNPTIVTPVGGPVPIALNASALEHLLGTWDTMAALYAIAGGPTYQGVTYFGANPAGFNTVDSSGNNTFVTSSGGQQAYVTLAVSTGTLATLFQTLLQANPAGQNTYLAGAQANTFIAGPYAYPPPFIDSVAAGTSGTLLTGVGFYTQCASSSKAAVVPTATTPVMLGITSGTTSTECAGLEGTSTAWAGKNPTVTHTVVWPNAGDLSGGTSFIGLASDNTIAADIDGTPNNSYVVVRFLGGTDTKFMCGAGTSSSLDTFAATGITPAAGTLYRITVSLLAGRWVTCTINGATTTVFTNLPAAATAMQDYMLDNAQATTAMHLDIAGVLGYHLNETF